MFELSLKKFTSPRVLVTPGQPAGPASPKHDVYLLAGLALHQLLGDVVRLKMAILKDDHILHVSPFLLLYLQCTL